MPESVSGQGFSREQHNATSQEVARAAGLYDGLAPCGTPMIFDAATPVDERDYSCVVFPSREEAAGNRVSFFVNGVLNSEQDSAASAGRLAQALGRPVVRIHNNSERWRVSFLGSPSLSVRLPGPDFVHCLVAKLVPALSNYVEPSVRILKDKILGVLRSDATSTVDIHAHSQGGIIVRGALRELREDDLRGLSEGEWATLSARIHVTTYGSAEHNFGVSVQEFVHAYDVVPNGTRVIDWVRRRLGDGRAELRSEEVGSLSHDFTTYMQDLPEFLAQSVLAKPYRQPSELAERMRQQRAEAEFGSAIYEEATELVFRQVGERTRASLLELLKKDLTPELSARDTSALDQNP